MQFSSFKINNKMVDKSKCLFIKCVSNISKVLFSNITYVQQYLVDYQLKKIL